MARKIYLGDSNNIARKVKQAYIGIAKPLPSGYTAVEYIYGNTAIDTGYKPNNTTKISMIIYRGETEEDGRIWPCSADIDNNNKALFGISIYNSEIEGWYGDRNSPMRYSGSYLSKGRYRITLDMNGLIVNNDTVVRDSITTFQCTSNLWLIADVSGSTALADMSVRFYSCKIYDNDILVRDFIPCENSSREAGFYDLVTNKFYTKIAGSRIGSIYAGPTLDSTNWASGVAHRIVKAYIGIGGVARPFWGGDTATFYGHIGNFSTLRKNYVATTLGDNALFAGGESDGYGILSSIERWDRSLTHTNTLSLSQRRYEFSATTVGDYALFAGGPGDNTVDAFNKNFTRSNPANLNSKRSGGAATTVGNYAIFGGGLHYTSSGYGDGFTSEVDAYNSSLTKMNSVASLGIARHSLAATTVGGYAIFYGGMERNEYEEDDWATYDTSSGGLDIYNSSLTKLLSIDSGYDRCELAATAVGGYALFGGGKRVSLNSDYDDWGDEYWYEDEEVVDVVTAFNQSLTETWVYPGLGHSAAALSATTVRNHAIFGGGYYIGSEWIEDDSEEGGYESTFYDTNLYFTSYDQSLVSTGVSTWISSGYLTTESYGAAASVGDYAIFGSGYNLNTSEYCPNILAFTVV